MTFSDIFKKSFLDGFTATDINLYTAAAAMLATCFLAVYVFLVYRTLTRKTFYSKNFNISLVGIAVVTAGIILTMVLLVLNHIPVAKAPMILVVNASSLDTEADILAAVQKYAKNSTVKSRNMTGSTLDLIVELRTAEGGKLVRELMELPSVTAASIMTHDGEVTF